MSEPSGDDERCPIRLGAFALDEPVGHGGMGSVWRGRHPDAGIEVAIKIMRPDVMDDPDYRDAFDMEVRSVASLNHPNIITILDFGRVSNPVAERAGDAVAPGAPYLVMEYGRGGSVEDYLADLTWADVREMLLVTLDALAHAHARDVIHRDLKPENILVGCGPDWRLKLTDFGLAHATDRFGDSGQVESAWGTPYYMAPEQLRGRWRKYGPWTDLYGLGCMAFELISGQWPFDGETFVEIANAHLEQSIPPLRPCFDVPDGVEQWLHRMLAKPRCSRFQHAADAAYALAQLPVEDDADGFGLLFEPGDEHQHSGSGDRPATLVVPELSGCDRGQAAARTRQSCSGGDANGESAVSTGQPRRDVRAHRPPFPVDWRRRHDGRISNELLGISLGLFGLRAIPLIDRNQERDRLWEVLGDVHRTGRAHQFVIEGGAGAGKSKLVQWLCRRAREVGAADVLPAYHSPVSGPADGLVPMLERFLGCAKLQGKARHSHLEDALVDRGVRDKIDPEDLLPLFEKQRATGSEQRSSSGPIGRNERYAIVYRLLLALARDRPLLVWLDDIQWGWDALGFAHHVRRRQNVAPAPLMIAMTARTEALEKRTREQNLLHTLCRCDGVNQLELPPLAREDTEQLIRHLLRLEPELTRQVLERSEGVPLFAVQLVEDWVSRGKLVMGEHGFELKKGADASLPHDLFQLWNDRLDGLVGVDKHQVQQLEIAAVLGQEVDDAEWRHALLEAGLGQPGELVKRLVGEDLARPIEGGWRFGHGMLQEYLERRIRQAGRWKRWNACCARSIRRLRNIDEPGVAERLAWHRLECGRVDDALVALSRAVDIAVERSNYDHALELVDWRDSVIADDSERWMAVGQLDRARVANRRGLFSKAVGRADAALEAARQGKHHRLIARSALAAGVARRELGDVAAAKSMLMHAHDYFGEHDAGWFAESLLELGRVEERLANYDRAGAFYQRSRTVFERLDDVHGQARCWNAEGDSLRYLGDLDAAEEACHEALRRFRRLRNITGVADSFNDLAELRRLQGDFRQARKWSAEALRLYSEINSEKRHVVRLNQAMIALETDDYPAGLEQFRHLVDIFERHGRRAHLASATAGLVAASAGVGDWYEARRALRLLQRRLTCTKSRPVELWQALQLARRIADSSDRNQIVDQMESLIDGGESRSDIEEPLS